MNIQLPLYQVTPGRFRRGWGRWIYEKIFGAKRSISRSANVTASKILPGLAVYNLVDLEELLQDDFGSTQAPGAPAPPVNMNTFSTGPNKGVPKKRAPRRENAKMALRESVVAEARVKFPFAHTPRTKANEMAIHRFVSNRLLELGLRPACVGVLVGTIVASYWIPRDYDIEAQDLLFTTDARELVSGSKAAVVTHWWHWIFPSGGSSSAIPIDQA